jgi:hypothetical protein
MFTSSTVKVPGNQTQCSARKTPLYLRRGTPLRMAVDRVASIDLLIETMLRKACRISPEQCGRHNDAQ